MAKVNVNGQEYEVDEEVAEQFTKFIRRSKAQEVKIKEGLDREDELWAHINRDRGQP